MKNFISLYFYSLTIKYNILDKISNLIYEGGGLILERNFDTNIHLTAKLTNELAEYINDNFPTVKINSLSNN
jgi:putative IMPACT (imprinted ancient) family translation regulator